MIALIMAGGRGKRMKITKEKLLLRYNKPLISHVVEALQKSNCFSRIIAATSIHSKQTRLLLSRSHIEILDTPGHGYVLDLNLILKSLNDYIFIISGDMPLIDKQIIEKIISLHDTDNVWTSYLVTKNFVTEFQISYSKTITFQNQECVLTGLSIVNSNKIKDLSHIVETYIILNDRRIAVNINTLKDYQSLLPTTLP
ncbi:MAG: NTP transferase domain-containing protein [Nitrosopumilaceae archaeon]|nr:NTP transferase domain-containing protein [Nitrosopumilaceae archaeon]